MRLTSSMLWYRHVGWAILCNALSYIYFEAECSQYKKNSICWHNIFEKFCGSDIASSNQWPIQRHELDRCIDSSFSLLLQWYICTIFVEFISVQTRIARARLLVSLSKGPEIVSKTEKRHCIRAELHFVQTVSVFSTAIKSKPVSQIYDHRHLDTFSTAIANRVASLLAVSSGVHQHGI